MKTLKELWQESGEKLGLKVKLKEWKNTYWSITGLSPTGEFYGPLSEGGNYYGESVNSEAWELCEEPEELVPHWPAIYKSVDDGVLLTSWIFPSLEKAQAYSKLVVKLATEYPPIMLPRKK